MARNSFYFPLVEEMTAEIKRTKVWPDPDPTVWWLESGDPKFATVLYVDSSDFEIPYFFEKSELVVVIDTPDEDLHTEVNKRIAEQLLQREKDIIEQQKKCVSELINACLTPPETLMQKPDIPTPQIKVVVNREPVGFAYCCNIGAKIAEAKTLQFAGGPPQFSCGPFWSLKLFAFKEAHIREGGFDTDYKSALWACADYLMRRGMFRLEEAEALSDSSESENLFYERWDEPKHKQYHPLVDEKDIVIYTATTGGHDHIRDNQASINVNFVAYSDYKYDTDLWELRPADALEDQGHNRAAKIYKVLPHRFFPDVEFSLWMDSCVHLKSPIDKIIEEYMGDNDILVHKHYARSCLYVEGEHCIKGKKDDPAVIRAQLKRYREAGYPKDNGLAECGVLLRRHNKRTEDFNEAWWDEIEKGSKRDQISFPYVAKKVGLKYDYFPGSFRDSDYSLFLLTPQIRKVRPE